MWIPKQRQYINRLCISSLRQLRYIARKIKIAIFSEMYGGFFLCWQLFPGFPAVCFISTGVEGRMGLMNGFVSVLALFPGWSSGVVNIGGWTCWWGRFEKSSYSNSWRVAKWVRRGFTEEVLRRDPQTDGGNEEAIC